MSKEIDYNILCDRWGPGPTCDVFIPDEQKLSTAKLIQVIRDMDRRIEDLERKVAQK